MICVYVSRKAYLAFNFKRLSRMKDFGRLDLQADSCTVKVTVSQKWFSIDTLFLNITNMKCHMAYWFVPFPLTLNDSPIAKLLKCNLMTICAAMRTVLTDTWRRAIPRRQPRLLSYLFTYHQPMVLEYAVDLLSFFCLLDTTDSFTHASATFSSPLSVFFRRTSLLHVY